MKKIISLALSLVLVSSAFAGSCLSAQETADVDAAQKIGLICSDPGFESRSLTVGYPATDIGMGAWDEGQKNEFGAGLSITDEYAANGKYSLKVKTPSWDKSDFALGLNVERNTVYTLSFKIKTVGADGGLWDSPATMKIGEPSISANNELVYRNITDNQVINDTRRTGWQQRYFTFNSGNADLVHMHFGSCDAGKLQVNSTMYLDDITLEKITDNGIIEPLANGSGFEEPLETFMPVMSGNGTMPSWTETECTKHNGGVSQSAENPHSGKYSCKILAPWGGGKSGIAAFNVCADTDYVFNFWARCDKADVNRNASVTVNELVGIGWATTNYSDTPLMSKTVFGDKLSNEWKQFTYVFHSNNAATVHLVIDDLDAAEPIYLDDITLQKSCLKNGAFETDTLETGATGWIGLDSAETKWDKWSHTSGVGSLQPITHYQNQEVRTVFSVKPYTNYKVSFNYQGVPNWLTVKIKSNNNNEDLLHQGQVAELCNIEQGKWHAWTNGSLIFNSLNNTSLLLTFMSPVEVNGEYDCGRLDDIYIVEQLDNTITVDPGSKLLFSVDKTSAASGDTVTVRLKAPLSDFVFEKGVEKVLLFVPDVDTNVVNNDDLIMEAEPITVPLIENDMEYTFTMKGYNTFAGVSATYKYNLIDDGKVDILDLVRLKKESSKEIPQYGAEDLAKLRIYLLSN